MMRNRKFTFTAVVVLVIFFLVWFFIAKHPEPDKRDQMAEQMFITSFDREKNCTNKKIKLSVLLSDKIGFVCTQTAYMTKQYFENATGRIIDKYDTLSNEGEVTLWLFAFDGGVSKINITKIGILNTSIGKNSICFKRDNSTLLLRCNSEKIYYQFEEK